MQYIIVNRCFGGPGFSQAALRELGLTLDDEGFGSVHLECFEQFEDGQWRTDPDVIRVVEVLGSKAWGRYSRLEIVAVPDDVKWHITDYDGYETVREDHRTW